MATTASFTVVLPLERLAMRFVRWAMISDEFDDDWEGEAALAA